MTVSLNTWADIEGTFTNDVIALDKYFGVLAPLTVRQRISSIAEAMAAAPSVAPRPPAREPWLQKQRKTKQPALPSSFRRPRPT